MNIRIPGSSQSSPRGGWRPLPVSYDAARLNATDIARGVAQFGEHYVKLRQEEQDARRKAQYQEALNAYDVESTRWRTEYNDLNADTAGDWEQDYMGKSEALVRQLVEGVAPEDREELQQRLLDRQARNRMSVIADAANAGNRRMIKSQQAQSEYYETMGNYKAARDHLNTLYKSRLINGWQERLESYKLDIKEQRALAGRLLVEDPGKLFHNLAIGEFGKLSPEERADWQSKVERELAKRAPQYKYTTEEDEARKETGASIDMNFAVRNGATQDEYRWRAWKAVYGNYNGVRDEITTGWKDEADNMPFPANEQAGNEWIEEFVAKWCDKDMGYGCDAARLRRYAKAKMDALLGKRPEQGRVDIDAMINYLPVDTVAPGWEDRRGGEKKAANRRAWVSTRVQEWMGEWYKSNPQPTYSQEVEAASKFIALALRDAEKDRMDEEEVASKLTNARIAERLATGYFRRPDDDRIVKATRTAQEQRHAQWVAENEAATDGSNSEEYRRGQVEQIAEQAGLLDDEDGGGAVESEGMVTMGKFNAPGIMVPQAEWDALQGEGGFRNAIAYVTTASGRYVPARVLGPSQSGGYEIGIPTASRLASFNPGQCRIVYKEGESSIGRRIIDNEWSPDQRVRINKLPSSDGGGSYEVLGINEKYHPVMASYLAGLVQSGADDNLIRSLAASYVEQYTDEVGMVFRGAGADSFGLEQFVRDMHFNGGPGGGSSVLARALGVRNGGYRSLAGALRTFLREHGEAELAKRLKDARDGYYKGIAARKPEKRVYLKGWLNRSAAMYKEALKHIREDRSNEQEQV